VGPAGKSDYDQMSLDRIEGLSHALHSQLDGVRRPQVDDDQVVFLAILPTPTPLFLSRAA